jgi:hypothetical protein
MDWRSSKVECQVRLAKEMRMKSLDMGETVVVATSRE